MRFYQYISDSKVDMLLPQIPLKAKQKITAEIGFDIKILTAKLKTERDSLDDRVSRLLVVERYLRESQRIGSLIEPAPWVSGAEEVSVTMPAPGAVVFVGDKGDAYFLLTGSADHLIGSKPDRDFGGSWFSMLAMILHHVMLDWHDFIVHDIEGKEEKKPLIETSSRTEREILERVAERFPIGNVRTRVEFLVRRLLVGTIDGKEVFVGTPLYVAQTDDDYVH
ncbi:MAG: SAVMC3_10250 family protein [Chthoniobacterales bacterium]